jgi:hypothetical protein
MGRCQPRRALGEAHLTGQPKANHPSTTTQGNTLKPHWDSFHL